MKCRIARCHAKCCYNVPFSNGELFRYRDKIVNPIQAVTEIVKGFLLPWTVDVDTEIDGNEHPEKMEEAMLKNKCPFLNDDCTCNIYENRPKLCRDYGRIPKLPCKYIKPE